jgi:hypothetical protein
VWGNGLDANVQVAPIALGTLQELLECIHIPVDLESVGEVASLGQAVEFGAARQLTPLQLYDLHKETDVPQHRYLLSQVTELLANPVAVSAAAYQPDFELVPALAGIADLGELLGVILDPQGNETYEQLGCVGLNTVTDELVATIDIKLPTGCSGGLCTSGSQEYVAFWANWGGGFQYVGTGSVNVHDVSSIPADGLQYSAALSFPQALTQCQPCTDGPLTITIRAVLSWGTPPSDLVSTNGGSSFTPMTEPFQVVLSTSPIPVWQTPNPVTGWCDYLEVAGVVDVVGNILGTWMTSGNGQIWISMEAQQGGVPIGAATPWQLVQLDNTAPNPVDIEITTGAGSCGDFEPGDLIGGTYSASDNEDLAGVTISVEAAIPGATLTQTLVTETLLTQTGTWTLQTLATTEPCGYVMVATASDNTIVNSGFVGFEAQAFQGFCLRPLAKA